MGFLAAVVIFKQPPTELNDWRMQLFSQDQHQRVHLRDILHFGATTCANNFFSQCDNFQLCCLIHSVDILGNLELVCRRVITL